MRDLRGRAGRSTSTMTMRPGAVRALLCFNCNGGLGQFTDDPDRPARGCADYVRVPHASQHALADAGRSGGQRRRTAASRPGQPAGRVGTDARAGAAPPRGAPGGPAGHAGGRRRERRMGERVVSWPERVPARLSGPGGLLVHRLPRRHRARPAARPPPGPAAAGGRHRAARHHDRRRHLRGRRPHGRRPARHHGQPDLQPRHREGLPGRLLQRHRHRRRRGHRDRDGQALPGRARALREDRGPHAVPRRQGQPPRRDDPRQPRRRHAGPRRRPAVRRLRPRRRRRHEPGPHLQLRRHRRELRGARLRRRRLRLAVRQELAEEDLAQRPARRRRHPHRRRGALRRRRRRLRHRRSRPGPPALPDRLPRRRRGRRPADRRRGRRGRRRHRHRPRRGRPREHAPGGPEP